ncbi:MAG: ferrous iron transporter B [Terriglobales bacterium]
MSSCCADSGPAVTPAVRTVAVVGPPNSGKTTLFNRLTGLRQKVANFPGVTVEHHIGYLKRPNSAEEIALIDLPGVYSLSPKSEDEAVTVSVLRGEMPGIEKPDAILLILDSTNLSRQLVIAAPVIALGLPTLVLLNMADSLEKNGGELDVLALARHLGTPVALVSAALGEGLDAVTSFLGAASAPPAPAELPVLQDVPECHAWAKRLEKRAGFRPPATPQWTRRLDALFLNKIWGPIIFSAVVIAVFQCVFTVGQPLTDLMHSGLNKIGELMGNALPSGWLKSMLVDAVWKGLTAVLVFLPQILLLFLVIGILEDSGYLARAAVIADRVMAKIGLNGKAFIPLLSAYACAVPAIMATRTIEDKRDRIATILVAPFMTCSARLPVYTLIIAAFIPDRRLVPYVLSSRAAAMLGLYVLGFLAAVLTARLLKSSVLRSKEVAFIMELPVYRWPTLRSLGLRLLDRAKAFLLRAGTVILGVLIVLWVLSMLPLHNGRPAELSDSVLAKVGHTIEPAIAPLGFNWKIGIGLISSLAARETIVSTLGTIYGVDAESQGDSMQSALHQDLSPAGAAALLVFFAFAMQCMSTLAVVRRETNSWKWPALQFSYMTTVAYVSAFATNQILVRLLS